MFSDMLGQVAEKLVRLPEAVLRVLLDLLDKLLSSDGSEWFRALKRFLRKENPWVSTGFPIWKTIRIGGYNSALELRNLLLIHNMQISRWVHDILGLNSFPLARKAVSIDLVNASLAELGFEGSAHYGHICARIHELGFELCPAEVGPQLRLEYDDQWIGEYLVIATEPVVDSVGNRHIFEIRRHDSKLLLYTHSGAPESRFSPDFRFVIRRPRKITEMAKLARNA